MIFGSKHNFNAVRSNSSINKNNEKLPLVNEAKNLRVLIDTELKFEKQFNKLLQKAYNSLKLFMEII